MSTSNKMFEDAALDNSDEARGSKLMITIRLDSDVIEWFKSQGRGYQTRMNDALRQYVMECRALEANGKSNLLQFRSDTEAA